MVKIGAADRIAIYDRIAASARRAPVRLDAGDRTVAVDEHHVYRGFAQI
jgi:hypothetical protein